MNLQDHTDRCSQCLARHIHGTTKRETTKTSRLILLDPELCGIVPLSNHHPIHLLNDHNEEEVDWQADGPVICIIRPKPSTCRVLAKTLKRLVLKRSKPNLKLICVPKRSFRGEEVLREEGVLGWFDLGRVAVPFGFVVLEGDVWSMEMEGFLRETKVEGDTASYAWVARALLDLGPIANIKSKGFASKEVLALYFRMQRELQETRLANTRDAVARDSAGWRSDQTSSNRLDGGEESGVETDLEDEEDSGFSSPTPGASSASSFADDSNDSTNPLRMGGPLDIVGGFPRPAFTQKNSRKTRKSSFAIDTIIVLDREIDMISPLSTPLTYESMLDESYGFQSGGGVAGHLTLNLGSSKSILKLGEDDGEVGEDEESEQSVLSSTISGEHRLSLANDVLFDDVRNVGVTAVMRVLNEQAKELKETQERVHRTRDVDDLKEFVKQIPLLQQKKQSLTRHIALAKRVAASTSDRKFRATWQAERAAVEGDGRPLLERAQDCAARGEPLVKVLRLLCLNCVLSGGFSASKLDEIRQDLVHAYGFDVIFMLDALERLGMLAQRPFHPQHKLSVDVNLPGLMGGNAAAVATAANQGTALHLNWSTVKKAFKLVVENVDDMNPNDCAYVFSGLAPLSVRLVQFAFAPGGWEARAEILKALDGPTICDVRQHGAAAAGSTSETSSGNAGESTPGEKKNMVVFYLGGVSRAEISALRFVSQQPSCPYNIIVATTKVINGNSLIESIGATSKVSKSVTASQESGGGGVANPFA